MGAVIVWQCIKCGREIRSSIRPSAQAGGKCPDTSSGNHVWVS